MSDSDIQQVGVLVDETRRATCGYLPTWTTVLLAGYRAEARDGAT
jgi:hypothetical protein